MNGYGSNQPLCHLIWDLPHRRELLSHSVKLIKNPFLGETITQEGDLTIIVLLYSHIIKLPSKYLGLYQWIGAASIPYQRIFWLYQVVWYLLCISFWCLGCVLAHLLTSLFFSPIIHSPESLVVSRLILWNPILIRELSREPQCLCAASPWAAIVYASQTAPALQESSIRNLFPSAPGGPETPQGKGVNQWLIAVGCVFIMNKRENCPQLCLEYGEMEVWEE